MIVLYCSPETCTNANEVHGQCWHSETENNLKTFLVGGCYVQLKSVQTTLFTIAVLIYLHQQGAFSDSKLINEFKKNLLNTMSHQPWFFIAANESICKNLSELN